MAETFKCPSCSAPLEFEGQMMQKCRHCGSSVIVPSEIFRASNSFGGVGSLDFGDISALSGKALKIAEIRYLIQNNQKINAIKVFRETFGGSLMEAKNAVDAVDKGFAIFDAELNKLKEFKDANQVVDSSFGFNEIAVDGDGRIYMITRTDKTVCKFSPDGKFLDRFKIEDSPNAMAVDNRGRIFISSTNRINVYDAEGNSAESFNTTQAFGLAFNDAGELFVASRPFVVKYRLGF